MSDSATASSSLAQTLQTAGGVRGECRVIARSQGKCHDAPGAVSQTVTVGACISTGTQSIVRVRSWGKQRMDSADSSFLARPQIGIPARHGLGAVGPSDRRLIIEHEPT